MNDDYLTPWERQREWLTGKRAMQEHPYATKRTECLLTDDQEEKLRTLFTMMNLGPDDPQVREMQLVVGIHPTRYGWRFANRKQAAQMIGMLVNYAKDRESERAGYTDPRSD